MGKEYQDKKSFGNKGKESYKVRKQNTNYNQEQ